MNTKKLLVIGLLVLFMIGVCIGGVSASKTIKMKGYKVKLSNKDIHDLKTHSYWSIYKSTHKKRVEVWYTTKEKFVKVKNYKHHPRFKGYKYKGKGRLPDDELYYYYVKKVKDYSRKGTVAFSVTSENGKYFAYLINDFPGATGEGGGYKVLGKKRIKL